jgi:hypothetical protein
VRALQTCLIRRADVIIGRIRFVTGGAVFHGIRSGREEAEI